VALAALVILASLSASGCDALFPKDSPDDAIEAFDGGFELTCGPITWTECENRARTLARALRAGHPGVEIISLQLTPDGYRATYSDGSSEEMIAN
jgi:hypothetical protein